MSPLNLVIVTVAGLSIGMAIVALDWLVGPRRERRRSWRLTEDEMKAVHERFVHDAVSRGNRNERVNQGWGSR